jgi:hypothetical protein
MRVLVDAKFVRRRTRPGERVNYYGVDDDTWEKVIRRRLASLASVRDIAADGIELAGPGGARVERLRVAHDVYDWTPKLFADARPASMDKKD